jgi:hypothetical protein
MRLHADNNQGGSRLPTRMHSFDRTSACISLTTSRCDPLWLVRLLILHVYWSVLGGIGMDFDLLWI